MLIFKFSPKEGKPRHAPKDYPALLKYNGDFKVEIDGKTFFSEPSFPIYEFLSQVNRWALDESVPTMLEYSSMETDDNPLIFFALQSDGSFCIGSPWQLYTCSKTFSVAEIREAIESLNCSM